MNFRNEINRLQEMLRLRNSNQDPPVDLYDLKGSGEGNNKIDSLTKEPSDTLLMGDEVISTTPKRENDEFIKSSVDDLVPIPRESEVTSIFDFLIEKVDVADLPRHLVKQLFSLLVKNLSSTDRMFDEPLGDDSKPRSYDVTFSNPHLDFNDDFTLCNDNLLFDEEFEDIIVLGDEKIDLLLRDDLDTILTGDREIDFNPCRDIEELERLLANDLVPIPMVFDEPLGNSDSMSRPIETSDLILEELTTEIILVDSISTDIDDRYYDSEGDTLYFEQLLNEDSSSDLSPALLPTESSLLVPPLPDPKQLSLREVERFDPFFSLTQSGGKTRVMETPSFGFHRMPSPFPAAYSSNEVMYRYYNPHLTSGDGFDHGPKMK
ncbi:hypothetical protein Tco_0799625 [Tanacetum coccineum]|uniref:Uncharacterized protein n=1 Tax=Tanacetum coccineum TaxID=301880 RepID=A0ABQ4ZRU7_9ASTR